MTRPRELASFTGSLLGQAAKAAPALRAVSMTDSMSLGLTKGRTASCTATYRALRGVAESPRLTESARVLPPATTADNFLNFQPGVRARIFATSPAGTTRTIEKMEGLLSKAERDHHTIGRPPSGRYCLRTGPPYLRPFPPATIIAAVSFMVRAPRIRRSSA